MLGARVSAVIPTLDAANGLGACIELLEGVDDIIVADGGSQDGTVAVANAAGARLVVATKGRGSQLRAGGAAATGEWLLFLHADTRLEADWREEAAAHIASRPGKAAYFRFRLDDKAWQARLIEGGVALRARLLGLPYGDQGLLISRLLYDNLGGYAAMPLMEDIDLVRRIGRRRLRGLATGAVTSAERWRRDGWLARSARNFVCLLLYRLGMSPDRVAKLYD